MKVLFLKVNELFLLRLFHCVAQANFELRVLLQPDKGIAGTHRHTRKMAGTHRHTRKIAGTHHHSRKIAGTYRHTGR